MDEGLLSPIWAAVLFAAVLFGPILLTSRTKYIGRFSFFMTTIATSLAMTLFMILSELSTDTNARVGGHVDALFALAAVLCIAAFMRWTVLRIQDTGASKWWSLLILVPLVGNIYWLILLFRRGLPLGELKQIEARRTGKPSSNPVDVAVD